MEYTNYDPDYLLFAQHGWADRSNDIGKLAKALASSKSILIAPSFNWVQTSLRIKPLIRDVEKIAREYIFNYPKTPLRIIGHSMGGVIWLEVLQRNPEWWEKVHSLVLIGSPIGGSDLARMLDPFGIGVGIARDLGENRRPIAEEIAQSIPTISIASNFNSGTDGLVTVENTKFAYSRWVLLSGIRHAALKCHHSVVPVIQNFWANPQISNAPASDLATKVIRHLQSVSGMTDSHWRDFERSKVLISLDDGITIRSWKNPLGIHHVFVADQDDNCLYAGYVGLIHASGLRKALNKLEQAVC